jgi:DNA repair protein RadC
MPSGGHNKFQYEDVKQIFEKNGFKLKEREYAVGVFEGEAGLTVGLLGIGEAEYVSFNLSDALEKAVAAKAKRIYLVHNHPNNDNRPSIADIRITSWAKKFFKTYGIKLVDHFIIAEKIISLKDTGLMSVDYLN